MIPVIVTLSNIEADPETGLWWRWTMVRRDTMQHLENGSARTPHIALLDIETILSAREALESEL